MSQLSAGLRPAQQQVLTYTGGRLAISAVPGAGKTFVLTQLATRLIAELGAAPSQILILTFMRSAAMTFRERIAVALAGRGLSVYGLQATTIHAFCLSVIQRQAYMGGADEGWETLSDGERIQILRRGLMGYLENPVRRHEWERFNPPGSNDFDNPETLTVDAAFKVLAAAKNFGLSHAEVEEALAVLPCPELAYMTGYYEDVLAERRAIDFDDQIRRAIALLESDEHLRRYYQNRYRFVLEDEAQDSTPAQNRLLELLTGGHGNLVRVGDSNQSITTTFTFNDPRYFREFCASARQDNRHVTMNESSRSGAPILRVANALVALTARHPDPKVATAFESVAIREATAGKANPRPEECGVRFCVYETKDYEQFQVLSQVRAHLHAFPHHKVAVLLATNPLVTSYMELFERAELPVYATERAGAKAGDVLVLLEAVVACLAVPEVRFGRVLFEALSAWWTLTGHTPSGRGELRKWMNAQAFEPHPYLFPPNGLPPQRPQELPEADYASAMAFCRKLAELFGQRHRPPYDLLASIARTLLAEGPTLDIAHKVAGIVRQQLRGESALTGAEETWAERPLPDLADIKRVIAELRTSNRQRSLVPNAEDLTPPQPGQVQVLTLHRSKGAEFDAVWIPDLGAYTIPRKGTMSRFPWDTSEVNLMGQKGLIAQAAVERFAKGEPLDEAAILESARQEAVAEKLRLLYVGITRAERFLTLSCNTYEGRVDPPRHIQELARLCQQ